MFHCIKVVWQAHRAGGIVFYKHHFLVMCIMYFLTSPTHCFFTLPLNAFAVWSVIVTQLHLYSKILVFNPHLILKLILTLKAPRKILEQTTICFYFLFFKENNA